MNQLKGLMSKVSGGHQTTEGDIKTIAIKYQAYKVLLEGYLHKRGDLGPEALRSWSKRYFMLLAPRSLFYFEDQSKAEQFKKLPTSNFSGGAKLAKGSVALSDNFVFQKRTVLDKQNFVFVIKAHSHSEREFVLAADTDATRDKWSQAVKEGEEYGKPKPVVVTAAAPAPIVVIQQQPMMQPVMVIQQQPQSPLTPVGYGSTTTPMGVMQMQPSSPMGQPIMIVQQPMSPGGQPVMVVQQQQPMMMVQQPAPIVIQQQPTTVQVDGMLLPSFLSPKMDAASIRALIIQFENVQLLNAIQINAIVARLAELGG